MSAILDVRLSILNGAKLSNRGFLSVVKGIAHNEFNHAARQVRPGSMKYGDTAKAVRSTAFELGEVLSHGVTTPRLDYQKFQAAIIDSNKAAGMLEQWSRPTRELKPDLTEIETLLKSAAALVSPR